MRQQNLTRWAQVKHINLWHYYTQDQLLKLLDMNWRMQLKRWRQRYPDVDYFTICNHNWYKRADVDKILQAEFTGLGMSYEIELKKLNFTQYDVALAEWVPRCIGLAIANTGYRNFSYLTEGALAYVRSRLVEDVKYYRVKDLIKYKETNDAARAKKT